MEVPLPIPDLDSPTLFVAAIAVALPLGALSVVSMRALPELRGIRHWGAASVCVTASLCLYIAGGTLAPVAAAADLLALMGLFLLRAGLVTDPTRAWPRRGWSGAVFAMALLVFYAYGAFEPRPERRAMVSSAALALAALAICAELGRPSTHPRGLANLAFGSFGLLGIGLGYRVLDMASGGARPVEAMVLGPESAVPLLAMIAAQVGGGVAFCGMAGHELIVRLRHAQRQLERVAFEDPLTGLASRRGILDRLGAEIQHAREQRRPLTVVMLDIDRFKAVNDQHGHAMGDAVLADIGNSIAGLLRPSDSAGRLGGEELVLILPGTTLETALRVAERLRTGLHAVAPAGLRERVTASFGLAQLDADDQSEEALLARADLAMYKAKRAGGDRVQVSERGGEIAALSPLA